MILCEKDVWKTHSVTGKGCLLHNEEYRVHEYMCHVLDRGELLIES